MVETFWTTFWTTYWSTLILSALVMGGISGGLSSWLATTKGRDSAGWFWIGFFCGPIGILALGLSPTLESKPSDESAADDLSSILPSSKRCPRCQEQIKFKAVVCRYCGHDFGDENVAESVTRYRKESEERRQKCEAEAADPRIDELKAREKDEKILENDLTDPSMLFHYILVWPNISSNVRKMAYIERFIRAGATVNYDSQFLRVTPLHSAVENQDERIVSLLLENGADVNASDLFGRTPLDYAIRFKKLGVMNMIHKAGGMKGKDITTLKKNDMQRRLKFVTFACDNCHKELRVPAHHVGKSGVCNHCGARMAVPKAPISKESGLF